MLMPNFRVFKRYFFTDGQAYVALSRGKSLDGNQIENSIAQR